MIKINKTSTRDLSSIVDEHFKSLEVILEKEIKKAHIRRIQKAYLLERIKKIITGIPDELIRLQRNYKSFCNARNLNSDSAIRKIFSYNNFVKRRKYNPYILSKRLGVNVCPYCNRQYVTTIVKNTRDVSRPDFDHFFSQEKYPMLALSFYNLIPSCTICNSRLKGRKKFTLKSHLNPYLAGFDKNMKFGYNPHNVGAATGVSDELEIILNFNIKAINYINIKGNCETFEIQTIYQNHRDIVREIVRKHYITGGEYLKQLAQTFPGMNTSEAELYQLAFGNYQDESEFERRPLSKLTKDIFDYLKFINIYKYA
jgi:hypothetical protein